MRLDAVGGELDGAICVRDLCRGAIRPRKAEDDHVEDEPEAHTCSPSAVCVKAKNNEYGPGRSPLGILPLFWHALYQFTPASIEHVR
jgi:hypothetical protein